MIGPSGWFNACSATGAAGHLELGDLVALLLAALAIASNNVATALALGVARQNVRRWRIVAMFGLTEFTVPLLGLALGRATAVSVAGRTHWLSPGLLGVLGVYFLASALRGQGGDHGFADRLTTWRGLAGLAIALSLDNVVVGYAAGFEGRPPLATATLIAVTSMSCTWIGLGLGESARRHWERPARGLAGLILLARGWATAAGWL